MSFTGITDSIQYSSFTHTALFLVPFSKSINSCLVLISRYVTCLSMAISALAPRLRFLKDTEKTFIYPKNNTSPPFIFFTDKQQYYHVSHFLPLHTLYFMMCSLPLYSPGHGDRKLVLFVQYFHEVLPAGWADGPERVGTSL